MMTSLSLSKKKSSLLVILFGILVGWSIIQNLRYFLLMNNDDNDYYYDNKNIGHHDDHPRYDNDGIMLMDDIPFKKTNNMNNGSNQNNVTTRFIDNNSNKQQEEKSSSKLLYGGQPYKYLNTSMLIKNVPNRQHRLHPKYSPFMLNTSYIDNNLSRTKKKPVRIRILLFEGPKISFRPSSSKEHNNHKLIGDEILNIAMDGFDLSSYFQIVNITTIPKDNHKTTTTNNFYLKEDDDIIWIVEMRLMEDEKKISIPERIVHLTKLTREYQKLKMRRQQQQDQEQDQKKIDELPLLRIIFMDYRDRIHNGICFRKPPKTTKGSTEQQQQQPVMKQLVDLLGGNNQNIREMRQQYIQGRDWSSTTNFTKPGHPYLMTFQNCWDYFPLHSPYTVRSDYANHVLQTYPKYLLPTSASSVIDGNNNNNTNNDTNTTNNQSLKHDDDPKTTSTSTITTAIVINNNNNMTAADTIRPIDVAHFWSKNQYNQRHCHLRDAVTDVVLKLNNTSLINNNQQRRKIQVIGDFISSTGNIGRTSKQDEYIDALLQTKIVVVAQRDSWEDHYRFFESIVGGALVMTDPMISLPEGYINATNIIIYNSLSQLKSLILYYLENDQERIQIARNGWLLALNHHRSYHWMERLFFGRKLTT